MEAGCGAAARLPANVGGFLWLLTVLDLRKRCLFAIQGWRSSWSCPHHWRTHKLPASTKNFPGQAMMLFLSEERLYFCQVLILALLLAENHPSTGWIAMKVLEQFKNGTNDCFWKLRQGLHHVQLKSLWIPYKSFYVCNYSPEQYSCSAFLFYFDKNIFYFNFCKNSCFWHPSWKYLFI